MPKRTIHVAIVTPYRVFFEGEADMVILTTKEGELGIQPGHIPLMAALVPGEIRLKSQEECLVLVATNGYAEINEDLAVIVVNAAEWAQDIDLDRAEEALARATQRFKDPGTARMERNHARHGMERAKARIRAAAKYQQKN